MALERVSATRFLNSLMEGGSRPALVKAEDEHLYVVKLRGAAQGTPPLRSEIIVGELGRHLGLHVPRICLVSLPDDFSKGEPDPELRELLAWSAGVNVGLQFVPEAIMLDPASLQGMNADLASTVVWLDALTLNVDRTGTNPNLLQRGNELVLIDHGAALYFHFNWAGFEGKSRLPFAAVQQHVLLPWASEVRLAGQVARAKLTPDVLADTVALLPDDLFPANDEQPSAEEQRSMYLRFLQERVAVSELFETEAERAYADTL